MLLQLITPALIVDLISFAIELVMATLAFYVTGRTLAGVVNAKLTDAFFISLFGLLAQLAINAAVDEIVAVPGLNPIVLQAWNLVSLLAAFIVWMILVQHFFDCLFVKGFLIVVVSFILILVVDYALAWGLPFILQMLMPGP
jgi:hypothetical protein